MSTEQSDSLVPSETSWIGRALRVIERGGRVPFSEIAAELVEVPEAQVRGTINEMLVTCVLSRICATVREMALTNAKPLDDHQQRDQSLTADAPVPVRAATVRAAVDAAERAFQRGYSYDQTQGALAALVRAGLLVKVRRGYYRPATQAEREAEGS